MYIESLSIENYKSFLEQQTLNFEPGFNLLVGANNAGKTTVLEVLDLEPGFNEPHRSIKNITKYGMTPAEQSRFEVTLVSDFAELRRLRGKDAFFVPIRLPSEGSASMETTLTSSASDAIAAQPGLRLSIEFGAGKDSLIIEGADAIYGRTTSQNPNEQMSVVVVHSTHPTRGAKLSKGNYGDTIRSQWPLYKQCIYRFSAQRKPSPECGNSGTNQLDREALNLPYCINHLQTSDAHGHIILCQWINRVFPSVKWVEAPPLPSGGFRLRCLPLSPSDRREDLATPLARMGSGIGNVIAMLSVVLTARHPQVIAIDEPNAFLHPRALRELLQILESEGRQHQYILTAHSPDVLTAISPRTIALLEFDGAMTTVRQVGHKNLAELRGGLADLGIRITDLHGRDQVLWVEGQTEELVMPELLRRFCPEAAAGTAVLRVEHTGTFRKKGVDPSEVVKLYRRLSCSSAFVPPMVCILLDREGRSEAECRRLESESNGALRFLEKPMFENYILHPGAIAATLVGLGESVTEKAVDTIMCETLGVETMPQNSDDVDGAGVLESIFSKISEARLEFSKTRDVPLIVSYLLDNHPESLAPLRRFLRTIFYLKTD